MILSEKTVAFLQNFARLNTSVVLRPGHVQSTWTSDMNVVMRVETAEDFPVEFGIYNVSKFLDCLKTMENPDLDFCAEFVTLKDATMSMRLYGCSPSLINAPPNKELNITNSDVTFNITRSIFKKILTLASINDLTTFSVVGKDKSLSVMAVEKGNNESNEVVARLQEWGGDDFEVMFKLVDLNQKVEVDDYLVKIKLGKFAQFISTTKPVVYSVVLKTK